MIFVCLAPGESLTQELVDSVRGKAKVVAANNAYDLAPWCDALAAADVTWWKHYDYAQKYAGPKYGAMAYYATIPGVNNICRPGINSGLLAIHAAVEMGAKKVLLLGYDMKGSHFFGAHGGGLGNPTEARFDLFKRQFRKYQPKGVKIINCTVGSALDAYPMGDLAAEIACH